MTTQLSTLQKKQEAAINHSDPDSDPDLLQTIQELETDLEQARTQFEEAHEEFDHHEEELQRRIRALERQVIELRDQSEDEGNVTVLEARIEELEQDLGKARERMEKVQELEQDLGNARERVDRVEELEQRIEQMAEKDRRLNETIEDLCKIEDGLKDRGWDEERAMLRNRVKELEGIVSQYETESGEKIEELMRSVEELTTREGELVEKMYQMTLENQELQEHVDELLESESGRESDAVAELNMRIHELEAENETLKDEVLMSKLDTISKTDDVLDTAKELKVRVDELEQNEHELKAKIKAFGREIESLNEMLDIKGRENGQLLDKIDVLSRSEDKLMEQLEYVEEQNEQLSEQLRRRPADDSRDDSREEELLAEVARLQEELSRDDNKELMQLRNKVDILLDTEEKLIDRLQQQEGDELRMQERLNEVEGELARSHIIPPSEPSHVVDDLREKVRHLELTEIELMAKVTGLNSSMDEYERQNAGLHEELTFVRQSETSSRQSSVRLQTRVEELEEEHNRLLAAAAEQKSGAGSTDLVPHIVVTSYDGLELAPDTAQPTVPLDPELIPCMTREQMISKLHELDQMERYHRAKIIQLTEQLVQLRGAVEVVAVTMETDAGMPVIKYRPRMKVCCNFFLMFLFWVTYIVL